MNGEIVIRRSWLKPLLPLVVLVPGAGLLLWAALSGPPKAALLWIAVVPCLAVIAVQIWEATQPGLITIRADGVRIEVPRHLADLTWAEVAYFHEFAVGRIWPPFLAWQLTTPSPAPKGLIPSLSGGLSTWRFAYANWRMDTRALVALLNARVEAFRR